jgi:Mrp family chromosome partitioning ATPase/LPS O-antigen subunit length determinant protein (WzzB/FepE family)
VTDMAPHPLRGPGAVEAPSDGDLIRLGAILAAIARGWWIVILATAACVALAWHYAVNVATPMYRASASIVLETTERAFIRFDETTGQVSRDTVSLNTQIGVLRGIDLMGRVVDALALQRDPEFNPTLATPGGAAAPPGDPGTARDVTVRHLLDAVQITNLPESLIFEVSVTTSDARKSMTIANTIAEIYIAEQVERKIAETQRAADWLRNRVTELQTELLQVETEVGDFSFGADGASTDEIFRREQLATEAETIETLYRYLLSRLQETIAQEGLQRPDSRILSSAMLPLRPAWPRQTRLIAVGAAAGLFLGLFGVFVREATRTGLRSSHEVARQTRAPVLGELPRVPLYRRHAGMRGLIGPRAVNHLEAVENLLTKLTISRIADAPHVVVVVSPNGGDGKTSVTLSMAQRFAERGHRVLAVDADTRKRTLSVNAGVQGPGLAGGLSRLVPLPEAVDSNEVLGCDILGTAGPLADPRLAQDVSAIFALIEAARASYDIVLVDTPPLNAVADALPYAVEADSVVLLSRWNHTSSADIEAALDMLNQVEADPCGVVVTRAKPSALRQTAFSGYFRRV